MLQVQSPHHIVKSQLSRLIQAISVPERLADDLFTNDLISHPVRNKVLTTPNLSQTDKARILMEDFLCYLSIFNETQKLVSFCSVLTRQDNPILTRISKEMLTT